VALAVALVRSLSARHADQALRQLAYDLDYCSMLYGLLHFMATSTAWWSRSAHSRPDTTRQSGC